MSAHCLSRADMDEHREICAADDFKKIKEVGCAKPVET